MSLVNLPYAIEALLERREIESSRLEFKKTWNAPIRDAVIKTLCAFANDLQGLNGGYVILGVEEPDGAPVLPPHGLDDVSLDRIQKELRGACKGRIDPEYQPVVAPMTVAGRRLLVLYAPAGDNRPYQAQPTERAPRAYFVRLGSETVEARDESLRQLLSLTARVPFDDRRRADVALSHVSATLLNKYLEDVGCKAEPDAPPLDVPETLRGMRLTAGVNGGESPRNAALLFFVQNPEQFIDNVRIEVAHIEEDGELSQEKVFRGPIQEQVTAVLGYLAGLSGEVIRKSEEGIRAQRFVAWPQAPLRDAVGNAVYHRGYEAPSQPIRIRLAPDRLDITSYPGPVPGLRREHFEPGAVMPAVPPRNPRIGEFLKALGLAETWKTGIGKIRRRMSQNGSGAPVFDFDEERTYFTVVLPAHPEYVAVQAVRDAVGLWVKGETQRALERLEQARHDDPASAAIVQQLIDYASERGDEAAARRAYEAYRSAVPGLPSPRVVSAFARHLVSSARESEARVVLGDLQAADDAKAVAEQAVLLKRANDMERAHRFFESVQTAIEDDPRLLHEFAGVKRALAAKVSGRQHPETKRKLNQEAAYLLRRVVELHGVDPNRRAWAWFSLAQVLSWLQAPPGEVQQAIQHARDGSSEDPRLRRQIEEWEG